MYFLGLYDERWKKFVCGEELGRILCPNDDDLCLLSPWKSQWVFTPLPSFDCSISLYDYWPMHNWSPHKYAVSTHKI